MLGQIHKSLRKRLAIVDIEHEIQQMEAELSYYKEKTRIFEKVLREQQHVLSQLKDIEYDNYIME